MVSRQPAAITLKISYLAAVDFNISRRGFQSIQSLTEIKQVIDATLVQDCSSISTIISLCHEQLAGRYFLELPCILPIAKRSQNLTLPLGTWQYVYHDGRRTGGQ